MYATIPTAGQIAVQRPVSKDSAASRFSTEALLRTQCSVEPSMLVVTPDAFAVLREPPATWPNGCSHQEFQIFSLARPTRAARMPRIKK
ncbi:hypothetical protein V8C35DRAFT_308354 [Trichoderma chlorosporum]